MLSKACAPQHVLSICAGALHIQCVCCGAQTMLCNAWRTQHISLHCPCQRNKHSALRHWRTTCLCTVANPRHTFAMLLATPASVSAANLGPFESNDHANTAILRVTAPLAQWHCLRLPALPRKAQVPWRSCRRPEPPIVGNWSPYQHGGMTTRHSRDCGRA